jgi:hypothetical protein
MARRNESLTTLGGLLVRNAPNAEPTMITISDGCQRRRRLPALHEKASHYASEHDY